MQSALSKMCLGYLDEERVGVGEVEGKDSGTGQHWEQPEGAGGAQRWACNGS